MSYFLYERFLRQIYNIIPDTRVFDLQKTKYKHWPTPYSNSNSLTYKVDVNLLNL